MSGGLAVRPMHSVEVPGTSQTIFYAPLRESTQLKKNRIQESTACTKRSTPQIALCIKDAVKAAKTPERLCLFYRPGTRQQVREALKF
jgi:hypothetical protein